MSQTERAKIRSLESLLFQNHLTIPDYQRPYKWSVKNVNQLMDDVLLHSDKTAYRLGTVVLHKDNDTLNVVDGQQRLMTLSLIAYELLQTEMAQRLVSLKVESLGLANVTITSSISLNNLKRNQVLIQSRINEFSRDTILFFFKKCQFVYIELDDVSEAFQFFDSQNTRGKDLAPHDLLKAYHLRKMEANTEEEKVLCVTKWEEVSDGLNNIFENYLFKIRQWSKGRSGLHFDKRKVSVFKGISIENISNYNFVQPYRINHYFTEKYNADLNRKIDLIERDYPFQIDMVIIDGKRFFEYVHYYAKLINEMESIYNENQSNLEYSILKSLSDNEHLSKSIFKTLKTYKGRNRVGDLYVRNLFDCCLLYYLDKFGEYKLDDAVVKFFQWSFTPRLEKQSVQEVTADNHARTYSGYFRVIREAVHTNDIIHKALNPVDYVGKDKAVKNLEDVVNLFNKLNAIKNHE